MSSAPRRLLLIASLLGFCALGLLGFGAVQRSEPRDVGAFGAPPKERGIALGLFSMDEGFDYGPLVEEIVEAGASHIALTVVWWQPKLHSTEIGPIEGWTPTSAQVRGSIREAKRRGLHVTLFPIVRLSEPQRGHWRGKLAPFDEDAWWRSYSEYILEMTRLADEAGADRISVGSELLSREHVRWRWEALIAKVRKQAPDIEVLYSANWDHFREVTFWDLVDVVGVTGYFEITKNSEASVAELERGWVPVKADLAQFSAGVKKRLVITEIGYPSIDGGAVWPWDETRQAEIDLEEQSRAYQAFARALSGNAFLEGVYVWNWFGFGGSKDGNYTPRDKPAAQVLSRWFSTAVRGPTRSR